MQSFLKGLCGGLEGAEPLEVEVGGRAREGGREGNVAARVGADTSPLLGSHSAPKCPFPRPAAAERLGCGNRGAGGRTRSRLASWDRLEG